MIADHSPESRVIHEDIEHFTILRTLRHQISDANNTIVQPETYRVEQLHQLVVTTVNVSNYNRATSHNPTCKCKSYFPSAPIGRYRYYRGRPRVSPHSTCSC